MVCMFHESYLNGLTLTCSVHVCVGVHVHCSKGKVPVPFFTEHHDMKAYWGAGV
jgi:hypothetical protein